MRLRTARYVLGALFLLTLLFVPTLSPSGSQTSAGWAVNYTFVTYVLFGSDATVDLPVLLGELLVIGVLFGLLERVLGQRPRDRKPRG